ncbi:MAG: hypothetical protein ACK421_08615 [Pseudanabaenaceae cyanobacterium]
MDDPKFYLLLQSKIQEQLDEVVQRAQKLARDFDIAKEGSSEKSPFRNVLAVAIETGSIEVLKNFIRYQMGRQGSSPIWKEKRSGKVFAQALIDQIDGLGDILAKITADVTDAHGGEKERISKAIHLTLSRLFLGYLAREHTALVAESLLKNSNRSSAGR